MLAEFDVEIGPGAPFLVVPWSADDDSVCFADLRSQPELIETIPESRDPAIRAALLRVNAHDSPFFTAKCDIWITQELDDEDLVFAPAWKHGSYLDVVARSASERADVLACERTMRDWVRRLRSSSIDPATVSIVLRACQVNDADGYYWTLYVSGFGQQPSDARETWAHALAECTAVLCRDSG